VRLHGRMLANMEAFFGFVGDHGPGGRSWRRPGVLAAICPAIPHRSVFNSVVYSDENALVEALDDLASVYDESGVQAWTVWTPARDTVARSALQAAGSVLDATPQAMAAPLVEIDVRDGAAGLDWERAAESRAMLEVLEDAFGWEIDRGAEVFADLPAAGHVYVARVEGGAAACVAALDVDGDCGIYNVGTIASARGRGLASGLMRQALLDAGGRGCETTSLQATAMGRPVYRALGYRELGVIEMWERRRPAESSS
jgi:GNAT superfamily N-acetyltransferase